MSDTASPRPVSSRPRTAVLASDAVLQRELLEGLSAIATATNGESQPAVNLPVSLPALAEVALVDARLLGEPANWEVCARWTIAVLVIRPPGATLPEAVLGLPVLDWPAHPDSLRFAVHAARAARRRLPESDQLGHLVETREESQGPAQELFENAVREKREHQARARSREAITFFVRGVGNQLRNTIHVIAAHAELIADGAVTGAARKLSADTIRKTTRRVFRLLGRMIQFAELRPARPTAVDLADRMIEAASTLRGRLPENVEIRTVMREDEQVVIIDPDELLRLVDALVDNAGEAMPRGGTLTIGVGSEMRPDPHDRPVKMACLTVSDTGTGIDPDARNHLFEPFYTTKRASGALGLGLSTGMDTVERAGGRIEVESQVGTGTTIKVLLPLVCDPVRTPAEAAAPAVSPPTPAPANCAGTILVVDDEPDLVLVAATVLERNGYYVLRAGGGIEAIAVVASYPQKINLLLTDLVMPSMGGIELAERLKALRPDVKVLFMSGAVARMPDGAPWLPKPFTRDELLKSVSALIEKPGG